MTENLPPQGEERQFKSVSGASIDGAPIAYIIVLAAVVAALSFIPFSIILGSSGGVMTLSQGILPLLGWLLGPIAGTVATGIGTLISVFLAPYTAGFPVITIGSAMLVTFAAGNMNIGGTRRYWPIGLTILFILQYCFYGYYAIVRNGIPLYTFFAGSFIDWSALLLFALPTRQLFSRWINSQNLGLVAIGLFVGTWTIAGVGHVSSDSITYPIYNWPQETWVMLIPIIPGENLIRCITGTVIGTGVISGLRALNLVKPKHAIY